MSSPQWAALPVARRRAGRDSMCIRRQPLPTLGIIMILVCCAGCPRVKSGVPVEGNVTLDGQPLPNVQVLFDQPETRRSKGYIGKTDEQGHYALKPLGEAAFGAAPGKYRVSLTTAYVEAGAREDAPVPPERIPAKFGNGKLAFDVPENGTKEANFNLKSRP